jgi:hypothetical protein
VSFINSLEPKLGHWAIPALLRITAVLQLGVFLLAKQTPEILGHLELVPSLVLKGEVWRLLSFVFLPPTMSFLFIIISTMFLFWMNDMFEQAWGRFRLNAYFFSCVALLIVAGFTMPEQGGSALATHLLFASLFLALSVIAPDTEIRLFLVIPIKLKYLGWLDAVGLVTMLLTVPSVWLSMLAVLIPFACFAGPDFVTAVRHGATVRARRRRFERDSRPDDDAFHRCGLCGVTDKADPHAEFRVTADGQEYCVKCLAEKPEIRNPKSETNSNER